MTYPTIRPELTLDFANSRQLDPRITFSRSSGATYLNPDTGLITLASDHEARFEAEGLLIEESRTNYTEYSTYEASNYENTNVTPTTNQLAPDGTSTAVLLTENTATGTHRIRNKTLQTTTNGTVFTWSVFVKPNGRTKFQFFTGYTQTTVFDVTAGTVSPAGSGTIVPYANGWYRLISTSTAIATGNIYQYLQTLNNSGVNNYAGDGTSGFYVWGWQSEGSVPFATSYIATSGQVGGVIRDEDICLIEGDNFSSWWNDSEGTIFAEFPRQTYSAGTVTRILSFASSNSSSMSTGEGYMFGSHTGGITQQRWRVRGASITGFNIPSFVVKKTALAYAPSDLARVDNGINLQTSTNSGPTGMDQLHIFPLNAPISRLSFYPRRLTDLELETLTL